VARFSTPSAIADRPRCLRADDGGIVGIDEQVHHEGAVDLEAVEREFLEIAQARIAGAGIVERDADDLVAIVTAIGDPSDNPARDPRLLFSLSNVLKRCPEHGRGDCL
jgi:hypothetical protein